MKQTNPIVITYRYASQDYLQANLHDSILHTVERLIEGRLGEKHPLRYSLRTAVDELCNNASEHGSFEYSPVLCRMWVDKNHFIFEVEDAGNGKWVSPTVLKKTILDRQKKPWVHLGKRGRGLTFLVSKIADKLSFTKSRLWGIKIRLEKKLI